MSQQWDFTFPNGAKLHVIRNSRRISLSLNRQTCGITGSLEVYNAHWWAAGSMKRQKIVITASNLEQLRASESEVQS